MKTLKTLKTLAILAALSPAAAMAESSVSASDLDKFRAAMTGTNCMVNNEEQAGQVERATGFSEDRLEAIVVELRKLGEIENINDQGGIRLISGDCAK
ncbi:MAG TPA: hypothetical protein ENN83_04070 [Rhodovulum sp.]|nr:hypothetical protein [Rhodovulum sp.]